MGPSSLHEGVSVSPAAICPDQRCCLVSYRISAAHGPLLMIVGLAMSDALTMCTRNPDATLCCNGKHDHAGQHFAAILGSNQSVLEMLLLKRKVKGPGWLALKHPARIGPELQANPFLLLHRILDFLTSKSQGTPCHTTVS